MKRFIKYLFLFLAIVGINISAWAGEAVIENHLTGCTAAAGQQTVITTAEQNKDTKVNLLYTIASGKTGEGATVTVEVVYSNNEAKTVGSYAYGWTRISGKTYRLSLYGSSFMGSGVGGYRDKVRITINCPNGNQVYTLTYDANGGETTCLSGEEHEKGENFSLCATAPTRAGYTFGGWRYNSTNYAADASFTMPDADATLVAQWTGDQYAITLKGNATDVAEGSAHVQMGATAITDFASVYNPGATILGYYTAARGGRRVLDENGNLSANVPGYTSGGEWIKAENTTLYAQYLYANYQTYCPRTLTFHKNGQSTATPWPADQTGKSGFTPTRPGTNPAVAGQTFGGWYTTSECTGAEFNFATVTEDMTLYAKWTALTYTFTLDKNLGTEDGSVTFTLNATEYDAFSFTGTRTGYTLSGFWSTEGSNGKGSGTKVLNVDGTIANNLSKWVADGKWIQTDENKKLYAGWTANTYEVRYNGNGNTGVGTAMTNTSFTYDAAAKDLRKNTFTRTGYTFQGWATTAEGAVEYTDMQSVQNLTAVNNGIVDLYAVWTINQYNVTYHHAGADHVEPVNYNANPVGFKPDACSADRVFVGWSAAPVAVQQTAPAYVVPTTVTITAAKDFYAVYASKNGLGEWNVTENFDSQTSSTNYQSTKEYTNALTTLVVSNGSVCTAGAPNGTKHVALQYNSSTNNGTMVSGEIAGLKKIGFKMKHVGGNSTCKIYTAQDGSAWTLLETYVTPGGDYKSDAYLLNIPVDHKYVKFEMTNASGTGGSYRIYVDDLTFYTEPHAWYYTDYSTSCDMAASATMTFAGATNAAVVKSAEHVGESVVLPVGVNAGKTFRHWVASYAGAYNEIYHAGEPYVLAHDVTMTAVWAAELTINGDVHLTSGLKAGTTTGIQVYTTTEANNLIELASEHLDDAKSIKIQYFDAEDNEITTKSNSLFRLCYAPEYVPAGKSEYNVADESNISLSDVDPSASFSRKFAISYTPTAAGVKNTGKIKFTLMNAGNKEITSQTITLYGRSLPEQFVVAAKIGGKWYALPADLSSNAAVPSAAEKIEVDNATTPTKATFAPDNVRYTTYARNAANSYRGAVRLKSCMTGGFLQATSSDAADTWLATTNNGTGHQDWYLSSSDFVTYNIDLYPSGGNNDRFLSVYDGKIGWYKTAGAKTFYLLPVDAPLLGIELDIVDWDASTVTLNMNGYSSDGEWAVETNGSKKAKGDRNMEDRTLDMQYGTVQADKYIRIKTYENVKLDGGSHYASGGTPDGDRYYKVPHIFTTDTMISSSSAYNANSILYVKSGKLTINTNLTISKVIVNEEAELEIKSGAELTIKDKLVLRTEPWHAAILTNHGKLTRTNVFYTRRHQKGGKFQQFSLPYASSTTGVKLSNGVTPTYGSTYTIRTYNCATRATNGADGSAWETLPAGTIAAHTGYTFLVSNNYYREFYFPVTIDPRSTSVAVSAHASENPADANWNFISSPLASRATLDQPSAASEQMKICEMVDDNEIYWQHVPTVINPVVPFYYQAPEDKTLFFTATPVASVAARVAADEVQEQWLQLIYENEAGVMDETNLYVHPTKFSPEYELGYDEAKMKSTATRPQIYTQLACGDLAFAAIPDSMLLTPIPVAVYSPATGEYTFSLTENDYLTRMEGVTLTDTQTGAVTNLLLSTYTVALPQGTTTGRFFLNGTFKTPGIATDIDPWIPIGGWTDGKAEKFLWHEHIYIRKGEHVYDVNGNEVKLFNE